MKNKAQHNDGANRQNLYQGAIKTDMPVNASRRSFAKSSVAVSGVLLTLSSRSALAVACQSVSGNLSGNQSIAHTQYTCTGLLPTQWSSIPPPAWPGLYSPGTQTFTPTPWGDGTLFDAANMSGITPGIYTGYSMMNVMLLGHASDPDSVGPHIAAAYLNAVSGRTNPALGITQVAQIYNSWVATNGYVPTPGATAWTPFEIVQYLQSTMGP